MPIRNVDERFVRRAALSMLSLALFTTACATLIHWFSPDSQLIFKIVSPVMFSIFAGSIVVLMRRPQWAVGIVQTTLAIVALALALASWVFTLQAAMTPGLELVNIFPPVLALLVIWMIMVMLFFPGRQTLLIALLGWAVIALPILVYLIVHPHEMWTPRGKDMLIAYGPVALMTVVLLPVQRGLTGKIRRLILERGRMETMINRDPLTRIYNRRITERILQDILVEKSPAGVIMFDMDKFKKINDTHGHPVGDRVLQVVATRCKRLLRQYESISRWGGEEFMVVVPNIDALGLQRVAKRFQSAISDSSVEPVGQVTASFGVTLVQERDNLASLLQRVDQALYQAKRRGGNCVVSAQIVLEGTSAAESPQLRDEPRKESAV
ncbi:MAG: diguanylate cyclase domain-containing protein [Gammaproteobacteria bacterium]